MKIISKVDVFDSITRGKEYKKLSLDEILAEFTELELDIFKSQIVQDFEEGVAVFFNDDEVLGYLEPGDYVEVSE